MNHPIINCLVYSKDRACQLDAFLRSMKSYWKSWQEEAKVSVIWTYQDAKYLAGYNRLFHEHSDISFISQKDKDFKQVVTGSIDQFLPYTVQFVDDIIFINPFTLNCSEFEAFSKEEETTCLSLRMHPKIIYCYMLDIWTTPPKMDSGKWAWKNLPGDWGYPHSADGHIFRSKDTQACFFDSQYSNPNELEDRMLKTITYRPYARCFEKAKIINIPSNSVGKNIYNRRGDISAEFLNDQYLNGRKINIEAFSGRNFNGVHHEEDYLWQ